LDLTQVFWKAIHSDHTVDSKTTEKAYTKVKRATLQKLVFYDSDGDEFIFKRPEGVSTWPIRWRLRNRVNVNGGAVEERNWVVDDGKFNILNEDLEMKTFESHIECDKKPIANTPLDNL
jgi:hypothetical protein